MRELKAAKSEKALIDEQVSVLLQLKQQLAVARGEPLPATGGGKKGKKK